MNCASAGIAADVAFAERVQRFGIDFADHVAQIQIAIGDFAHVAAAHVAEIAFFTFGHEDKGGRRKAEGEAESLFSGLENGAMNG